MATILLIEPHPLLRLGLRHLLVQSQLPIEVIDVDPLRIDPKPTIAEAAHCHADLLVFGMTPDNGWPALETLCAMLKPKRVLVLADEACPGAAESMAACDVRGFLSKACSAEVLDAAIRLVLAGGECFPSWLHAPPEAAAGHPSGAHPGGVHGAAARGDGLPHGESRLEAPEIETPALGAHMLQITERQYEVLTLLARGYPIKTISRILNISVATAKTHACTLYQRLQVRNKGEAVYEALRRGAKLNWPGPATPGHAPATVSAPLAVPGIGTPALGHRVVRAGQPQVLAAVGEAA